MRISACKAALRCCIWHGSKTAEARRKPVRIDRFHLTRPCPALRGHTRFQPWQSFCARPEWSRQGLPAVGAYLRVSGPWGPLTSVYSTSRGSTPESQKIPSPKLKFSGFVWPWINYGLCDRFKHQNRCVNHCHATGRLCDSPATTGRGKIQVSCLEPHYLILNPFVVQNTTLNWLAINISLNSFAENISSDGIIPFRLRLSSFMSFDIR